MRRFDTRPEAVQELSDAADWYEHHAAPGLGAALIADYERRLSAALDFPGVGSIVGTTSRGTPIRRYRLSRFERLPS